MENGIAVNVAVRVRPLLASEDTDVIKYIYGDPPVLCVSDKRNVYAFDNIFSSDVQQCEIYNVMLKPLVSRVLSGYNGTILAYGQTGTGKTYTMGSNSQKYRDAGLIPRVLDEFFEVSTTDADINLSISFIEIYNEKVYDLLQPSKTALTVKGFSVYGMTCVPIERSEDACHWLLVGGRGRHVRHTALNASSSRSHAVFTVYCTQNSSEITSKLHLVDLAGSESVRRTGNQGQAFQEGVTINRGLFAVGRVISALSDKRGSVIPYRDSTLTTILHDSLSTNNYVSLLACVSPSENDVSETLATLRFAVTAKALKNKPQLETIIAEYDRTHPGILNVVAPVTTVKKKRRRPTLFTSTQVKRSLIGTKRNIIPPLPACDSPTYATVNSESVSSSTMIEIPQPQFNLSSPMQRCTQALKDCVLDQVNRMLQNHVAATPAPITKEIENTPPGFVQWSSVERKVTEIIRNELAQLTVSRPNLEETRKLSSPITKRQLRFDSPSSQLNSNNGSSPILRPSENLFKLPVGRAIRTRRATEKMNISVSTSPKVQVAPRRSMRLSIKHPEENKPVPAPRLNMTLTNDVTKINEIPAAPSPFKPTRRSVRLSMKCFSPKSFIHTPAPAPRFRTENQNSDNKDMKPIPTPAPRKSMMVKTKTPSKVGTPKLSTTLNISPSNGLQVQWISPKKTKYTPRRKHREQVLRTLNRGTQKDLQILSTVGVKTALQIITYRTLNGEFKNINDMKKIPAWHGKRFERFMLANQLHC